MLPILGVCGTGTEGALQPFATSESLCRTRAGSWDSLYGLPGSLGKTSGTTRRTRGNEEGGRTDVRPFSYFPHASYTAGNFELFYERFITWVRHRPKGLFTERILFH